MRGVASIFIGLFTFFMVSSRTMAISVLKEGAKVINLTEASYFIYEDKEGRQTINSLLANPNLFKETNKILPENDHRESVYWVKFSIIDSSLTQSKWLIELYNYRIDSIEIYVVYKGKIISKKKSGDHLVFGNKEIPHKNFAYLLPSFKNDTLHYYFKIKSERKVDFYTVVKSVDYFIGYSNGEYYLLGMLYGILAIMLLYNFFYFIILRDRLYFFYLSFTIGFMLYFMAKDGTGFQYLWNDYPFINDKIPGVAICFSMVSQLLFTHHFYKNSFSKPIYSITLWVVIFCRIIFMLLGLFVWEDIEQLMVIDLPIIVFMLWLGIINIDKNEIGTFYFPIGMFLFLIGFSTTALFELNLISHSGFLTVILAVYASTFGVVAQIAAFWGSLSFRHRMAIVEKKMSEYELQIKNLELDYLQKYKNELEQAVETATESIKKKNSIIKRTNQNLETFIYKASHNLRSPISTIMGLYHLSKKETETSRLQELFEYTNKSIVEMDRELTVVSKASSINNHEIRIERVNLFELVKEYFEESTLSLSEYNKEDFWIEGDYWLLKEGIQYIKNIQLKLTTDENNPPKIEMKIENSVFVCNVMFECKTLKSTYADNFFTPYHKDIGHLYGLYSEPYLCQAIMDKLRGSISMTLGSANQVIITIRSRQ